MAVYHRIQRVFPGLMGTVFIGARHSNAEHREMAVQAGMPWLIADYPEEGAMSELTRYVPGEGTNMVLLSREGGATARSASERSRSNVPVYRSAVGLVVGD